MQEVLRAAAVCSLTMSFVAVVFMCLSPLFNKIYQARLQYYAWLIIIIGFIIPLRPDFGFGLFRETEDYEIAGLNTFSQNTKGQIGDNENIGNQNDNSWDTLDNIQYQAEIYGTEYNLDIMPDKSTTSSKKGIDIYVIIGIIWLGGIVVFIFYQALRHYRFIKLAGRWSYAVTDDKRLKIFIDENAEIGNSKHVRIKCCELIKSPMMTGFFHPVILLPPVSYADDEFRLIIKHELIHIKQKDMWYKSLVLLAQAFHWFNPVIHLASRRISLLCELSCDEGVIRSLNVEMRRRYGEAIIGAAVYQTKMKTSLSTNFNGGKKIMKNRISSILNMKKKKLGIAVICGALVMTAGTGIIFASPSNNSKGYTKTNASVSAGSSSDEAEESKASKGLRIRHMGMSAYEEFGLVYDQEKGGYYYDGKLAGLLVDNQRRGYLYLSSDGEINLKAVRDDEGKLTGLVILSQEEYDAIIAEYEDMKSKMSEQMDELRQNLSEYGINLPENFDDIKGFSIEVPEDSDGNKKFSFELSEGFGDIEKLPEILEKLPEIFDNFSEYSADSPWDFKERSYGRHAYGMRDMDMSVYEQYGLVYDEEKNGYCYNGELISMFIDQNDRGTIFMCYDGEVKVTAVRDENGELTGLAVLSDEEYEEIISKYKIEKFDMNGRMNDMKGSIKERMEEFGITFDGDSFDAGAFDIEAFDFFKNKDENGIDGNGYGVRYKGEVYDQLPGEPLQL